MLQWCNQGNTEQNVYTLQKLDIPLIFPVFSFLMPLKCFFPLFGYQQYIKGDLLEVFCKHIMHLHLKQQAAAHAKKEKSQKYYG